MIVQSFIQRLANYIDAQVAKVVLNHGAYIIDHFHVKRVSEGQLALTYTVPQGSVDVINHIELQDQGGNVISSNGVHVPITADTLIHQTIQVSEVIHHG